MPSTPFPFSPFGLIVCVPNMIIFEKAHYLPTLKNLLTDGKSGGCKANQIKPADHLIANVGDKVLNISC